MTFDTFQNSFLDLKVVLNADKTKYMLFSRARDINYDDLQLCTLNGTSIERVPHYKYLGIWVDDKFTFKKHIDILIKDLRVKLGFFYRNRSCFPWSIRKRLTDALVLSVLDYGDIIYRNASATTLKPLDALFHSALRFITGDSYTTHHCILYNKVGWPSLTVRRDQHWFLFIYKALIRKLPPYLNSLLVRNTWAYHTRSQDCLMLEVPCVSTDLGKTAFKYGAPHTWNILQGLLKYDSLYPLEHFQSRLTTLVNFNCTCYEWCTCEVLLFYL